MTRLLTVCILLAAAFMVFRAGQSKAVPAQIIDGTSHVAVAATRGQVERPANTEPMVAPVQITATALYFAYQRNEVAADNSYKGRLLSVRGIVKSISKNFRDQIYVNLATMNEFESAQAYLAQGNEAGAANLQVGEVVSLSCIGGGLWVGSPVLTDCSFLSEPQEETVKPEPAQMAEAGSDGVYRIGGAVSAPVLTYSVEPEYSEEARQQKLGGNVLVNLVVDANGIPQRLRVLRGVGAGLDEEALRAVGQYRFQPGMAHGVAVPVELNVQVAFQTF